MEWPPRVYLQSQSPRCTRVPTWRAHLETFLSGLRKGRTLEQVLKGASGQTNCLRNVSLGSVRQNRNSKAPATRIAALETFPSGPRKRRTLEQELKSSVKISKVSLATATSRVHLWSPHGQSTEKATSNVPPGQSQFASPPREP